MLTRKQNELLAFIADSLAESGISPSFDEMKAALGLKSKSGIHRLITALEERGFIRRLPHRARAIKVLRTADSALPGHGPALVGGPTPGFAHNVIEGNFAAPRVGAKISRNEGEAAAESLALPMHGRIAAGTPIEALQDNATLVDVPASILGSGEHFALEVAGDSMVDVGIFDGDTAIIERCQTADNGAIVVALIDDHEATLKRLRRKGDTVALEAANPAYETRIFGQDRVKVQGRLIALMRRY